MIDYNGMYKDFFDIDQKYFPCVDDSAINSGDLDWTDTFPHKAFVDLLKGAERMLSGTTRRALWIHGAYGTGKSKCAYALKKILDVTADELKSYWDTFDNLRNNPELLMRLLGHKERGVLTCYRYASGGITTPRDLFFAIQEELQKALVASNFHLGTNGLKDSVIAWLSDASNKLYFDAILKEEKWHNVFSQTSTDEVLAALNSGKSVKDLMDNIFSVAEEKRIAPMTLDADRLKAWIKEVIAANNNLKIVFIWDEFSGFFKQNKNSLDEFQKIVALCEEAPFYMVVVTHQTDSLMNEDDQSWQVVKQRFDFSQITLPPNIAFDLIWNAFKVKKPAEDTWNQLAGALNDSLSDSRREVMKAANITNPKVIRDIMPIHPLAALVLKNIATSFQSNQRSMFDFIKTRDTEDVHAFQWFIENTGPMSDHPLLTIDLLWDFFYEKGKDNLTSDIRMILDTFNQQKGLRADEQRVLKTILIMQAIDKRVGGEIDVIKPTEQNIAYAFEGISDISGTKCINIARALKNNGVLVLNPIGNNKFTYGAAVLAGDQAEIDKYKKDIIKVSTNKLVDDGKLATVLSLSPALRLRFAEDADGALIPVTYADFTRTMNGLKTRTSAWHFNAVIAFAKDKDEAEAFRKVIKDAAIKDDYRDIVIIDALSTPLDSTDFENYVEYSAMASYHNGRNKQSAEEYSNKAKQVLALTWKNRIYNGQFVVYYEGNRAGEIVSNASGVAAILQKVVVSKYPYVFDFTRGITENQLKLTQAKPAAKCVFDGKTTGVMVNAERFVLSQVWTENDYWNKSALSALPISIIKKEVESLIQSNFGESGSGKIGVAEIYECLINQFGFAPCNLTAFLFAFLVKEYSTDPYRYLDANGSGGSISHDKLAEMIKNCMDPKKPINSWVVRMTPEEMAFYELTRTAWHIDSKVISTADQASILIKNKIQQLKLPVWSLEYVDDYGVYDVLKKYIHLVQSEGPDAHRIATEIGKIAINKYALAENLEKLLTPDNCQKGMKAFLAVYDDRKVLKLAEEIGATGTLISDISNLFSVEYSSLWKEDTGKEQIDNLYVEYLFVKISNSILNITTHSKFEAFDAWAEKLKFSICSCDGLISVNPEMTNVWEFLLKIYQRSDILPLNMRAYTEDLKNKASEVRYYFDNEVSIFFDMYKPYLGEISQEEIRDIKPALVGIFRESKTRANEKVKNAVEEYLKNQTKAKLFNLWKDQTGTKSPLDWSHIHRTPILRVVKKEDYDVAKKTFETLNRGNGTEIEINKALEWLSGTDLFTYLSNEDKINKAFASLLGKYKAILTNYDKVRDELEKLPVYTYDWDSHPAIWGRVKELALAEYNAGGSDRAVSKIEGMSPDDLKKYLIDLVKERVDLGLEILNGGK